ncbi:MAG: DivIVA domain-containing protein [Acidobacteriota bacterium]
MTRLTPLEIQRATFSRRFRGLDPEAVRQFLSEIAEDEEEDARIRGELRAQVARLSQELEEFRSRSDALNEALVAAQKTAEATIAKAELEAQRVVAEAQSLADRVIEEATRRAENIELVVSQMRMRRRSARSDLRRLAELLAGLAKDDETDEDRDNQSSTVALLRPRQREGKAEK